MILQTHCYNFDPEIATSGKVRSIIEILDYIPQIKVADLRVETLNMEWRLLPDVDVIVQKAKNCSFVQFWSFVFDMKNELNEFVSQFVKCCSKCNEFVSFFSVR